MQKLILPLKEHLPAEHILGIGLITLISIVLILVICYLAGMLVERKRVKSLMTKLEDNLLVLIPGYALMKSRASESIIGADDKWQAVMVGENDEWEMGIRVDHQPDGFCTVFFPEPPDAKSGEMKLVHESKLKKLNIEVSELVKIIRKYGEGGVVIMESKK